MRDADAVENDDRMIAVMGHLLPVAMLLVLVIAIMVVLVNAGSA